MKKNAIFDIAIGACLLFAIVFDIHFGLLFACPLFIVRGVLGLVGKK
ncbi:MAG: hypothetical protein IJC17_02380 [Clostridia bacterium]|nr:hypothetical protein [Clostridia bacterium]